MGGSQESDRKQSSCRDCVEMKTKARCPDYIETTDTVLGCDHGTEREDGDATVIWFGWLGEVLELEGGGESQWGALCIPCYKKYMKSDDLLPLLTKRFNVEHRVPFDAATVVKA